jgi:hypothetical protein
MNHAVNHIAVNHAVNHAANNNTVNKNTAHHALAVAPLSSNPSSLVDVPCHPIVTKDHHVDDDTNRTTTTTDSCLIQKINDEIATNDDREEDISTTAREEVMIMSREEIDARKALCRIFGFEQDIPTTTTTRFDPTDNNDLDPLPTTKYNNYSYY